MHHVGYSRIAALSVLALGLAACAEIRETHSDPPLDGAFIEEFRVPVTSVSHMAFSPDGDLVVLDGGEHTVTVLDDGGREASSWKTTPDPSSAEPSLFAVSHDSRVAVDTNAGRIDVFTLDGDKIASHRTPGISVTGMIFDGHGHLLVKAMSTALRPLADGAPREITRIPEGDVLWASELIPGVMTGFQPYRPSVILANAGPGRIAVGMNGVYDLAVLDSSTGAEIGRIARDVPLRGPDEAFIGRVKALAKDRVPPAMFENMTFPETFPVMSRVFTGPPGAVIWIRRHLGIDDHLSPSVEEMGESVFRLYDLFSPKTYEFMGTVQAPEGLDVVAANEGRIAGVVRGPFDEPSIAVYRWSSVVSQR